MSAGFAFVQREVLLGWWCGEDGSVCDGVVYNAVGELYSILCSIVRENTKSSRSSCLPYLRYLGRWLTEGFHPAYSVTVMYGCIVTFALVVGVTLDS